MLVNRTFEALAHVRRREVIHVLGEHDRLSAGQIAELLDVPGPTLSGHLNVLKSADLIVGDREGTTIWYRLNLTVMEEALGQMLSLLSRKETAHVPPLSRRARLPVITTTDHRMREAV
ncbi:metalloregulator ArsR/SmtB family transcription factor [Streptosporangium sp. NPDC023615]|uniref:metalloregulator ArsR/SmtB family transcription factor n=1 Tax=Streptosporangium sp. NPDC023615 TaxID=3154794 RepID=UPI00343CEFFF